MANEMHAFYDWTRLTRAKLFDLLEELPEADFVGEHTGIARGSIRNLLVHVADVHAYWLSDIGLGIGTPALTEADYPRLESVRGLFGHVDNVAERFLAEHGGRLMEPCIRGEVPWKGGNITVTPLWLLTHIITHEFHHKGQIATAARQLGCTAKVDLDLVLLAPGTA